MFSEMTLNKPLAVYDTETTGTQVSKDEIIQLHVTKFHGGTVENRTWRFNPSVDISESALSVHGITKESLANEPKFKEKAKEIHDFMVGCVWCGYNSDIFDEPILTRQLMVSDYGIDNIDRLDVIILVKKFFSHKLSNIYKMLTGRDTDKAHDAEFDVEMTYNVLNEIIGQFNIEATYESLQDICGYNDQSRVDAAGKLSRDESGEVVFNFGKHFGKPIVSQVKYCQWILSQDTFSEETKGIIKGILDKVEC